MAQEIFFTGTSAEIIPITSVEHTKFTVGQILEICKIIMNF